MAIIAIPPMIIVRCILIELHFNHECGYLIQYCVENYFVVVNINIIKAE